MRGANLANANARAVIYFPEGRFVLHNDDDNVVDPTSANQKYTDSKGNNRSEEIFIRGGVISCSRARAAARRRSSWTRPTCRTTRSRCGRRP